MFTVWMLDGSGFGVGSVVCATRELAYEAIHSTLAEDETHAEEDRTHAFVITRE